MRESAELEPLRIQAGTAPPAPKEKAREAPSLAILHDFREALRGARRTNVERIEQYRRRAAFPEYNPRDPTGLPRVAHRLFTPRPVFIDERGTSCAVAYLMQQSGWVEEAAEIARSNVNVKVEDVDRGPLFEWVLRSGFTHDEVAVIQPEYDMLRHEAKLARIRERQRLMHHFAQVERQLATNTEIALDIALARIHARIADASIRLDEIGGGPIAQR